MGIHVVAKFTGSAGEHIVDESVENQNERFETSAAILLGETQMTTFMKNTKTTQALIYLAGKESVHHFTSRFLQCSFIVFRIVLLIGSYLGVIESLLVFDILNIMFQDYSLLVT